MFGLAHLGVPLSVPILILIGVMLGYARVLTGGVCIPILLHFIHNMLV
jgi:membrane protease YdiL (CAAX protease family)